MVTGAAGTIGSEICRQLIQQNVKKIIAIDKSELGIYNQKKKIDNPKISYKLLDINDQLFLDKIIQDNKIDIIYHTAAYKHVNILENNIYAAIKNNILATYHLCTLAVKNSCEMIFISTDKATNLYLFLVIQKELLKKFVNILILILDRKKKLKLSIWKCFW